MLTIANNYKALVLLSFFIILGFGLDFTAHPTSIKIFATKPQPTAFAEGQVSNKLKATVNVASAQSSLQSNPLNREEIQLGVQKMDLSELNARKADIESEIGNKQMITRFNEHQLTESETNAFRRLAFEKSLITIRLFELN